MADPRWRESPEITDLIVDFDAAGVRRPVRRAQVVELFRARGNERAARVVEQLPAVNGVLDEAAVDVLMRRVHMEMQRLSEEFHHGRRVLELLAPVVRAIRGRTPGGGPVRVVDVGCGTGYVLRWLAAHGLDALGEVELIGADYNAALLAWATELARMEGLRCTFVEANAFELAQPAAVLISTGVIHHFQGGGLRAFLARHELPSVQAFFHYDFQPSVFAHPGAWLFHFLRFKLPLARHDGVLSAVRAHPGAVLRSVAREALPGFQTTLHGTRLGPFPRAFHALLGVRSTLRAPLERELGRRVQRLSPW